MIRHSLHAMMYLLIGRFAFFAFDNIFHFSFGVSRIESVTFRLRFSKLYTSGIIVEVGPGYRPEIMCSADSRTLCLPRPHAPYSVGISGWYALTSCGGSSFPHHAGRVGDPDKNDTDRLVTENLSDGIL